MTSTLPSSRSLTIPRLSRYLDSLSPSAMRIWSASSLAFSACDSGITMIAWVAANHRLDAPTNMSLVSFLQPLGSKASRCGCRPRQRGSFARPASPCASFMPRRCSQEAHTMVADAPFP